MKRFFLLFFLFFIIGCQLIHRFDENPPKPFPISKDDVSSLRLYINSVAIDSGMEFLTQSVKATQSINLSVSIKNISSSQITVNSISFSPYTSPEYEIIGFSLPYMLNVGEEKFFTIKITPATEGFRSVKMTINSNDIVLPNYVAFLVTNVLPPPKPKIVIYQQGTLYPNNSTYNFGQVSHTGTYNRIFTIKNEGELPLDVTSISLTNTTDFEISHSSFTGIAAGTGVDITLTLKSGADGTNPSGILKFQSNDTGMPLYSINLIAERVNMSGSAPNISVNWVLKTDLPSDNFITVNEDFVVKPDSSKIFLTFSKPIVELVTLPANTFEPFNVNPMPSSSSPQTSVTISRPSGWSAGKKTLAIRVKDTDNLTKDLTKDFQIVSNVVCVSETGLDSDNGNPTNPTNLNEALKRIEKIWTKAQIKLQNGDYTISNPISLEKELTIGGGYDASFSSQTGYSSITSTLTGVGTLANPNFTIKTMGKYLLSKLRIFGPDGSYTTGIFINRNDLELDSVENYGGNGTELSIGAIIEGLDLNFVMTGTIKFFGRNLTPKSTGGQIGLYIRGGAKPNLSEIEVNSMNVENGTGDSIGIVIDGNGTNVTIDNNSIIQSGKAGAIDYNSIGIDIKGGGNLNISGSTVLAGEGGGDNNAGTKSKSIGINIIDGINSSNNIVLNNCNIAATTTRSTKDGQIGTSGVYIFGNHKVTIEDCNISGGKGNTNVLSTGVVVMNNNTGSIQIKNISGAKKIKATDDSGVLSKYGYGIFVQNCNIAINIENCDILGGIIDKTITNSKSYAIYSFNSNINIKNSVINGRTGYYTTGVYLYFSLSSGKNFMIDSCNITGGTDSGLVSKGIDIDQADSSTVKQIKDSYVTGNNNNSYVAGGIYINKSNYIDIFNNQIKAVTDSTTVNGYSYGVYLNSDNHKINIYDNQIEYGKGNGTFCHGIYITGNSDGKEVNIYGTTFGSQKIYGGTNLSAVATSTSGGLRISSNGTYNIYNNYISSRTIANYDAKNNYGVYIGDTSIKKTPDIKLYSNKIYGGEVSTTNNTTGLYVVGCETTAGKKILVYNNVIQTNKGSPDGTGVLFENISTVTDTKDLVLLNNTIISSKDGIVLNSPNGTLTPRIENNLIIYGNSGAGISTIGAGNPAPKYFISNAFFDYSLNYNKYYSKNGSPVNNQLDLNNPSLINSSDRYYISGNIVLLSLMDVFTGGTTLPNSIAGFQTFDFSLSASCPANIAYGAKVNYANLDYLINKDLQGNNRTPGIDIFSGIGYSIGAYEKDGVSDGWLDFGSCNVSKNANIKDVDLSVTDDGQVFVAYYDIGEQKIKIFKFDRNFYDFENTPYIELTGITDNVSTKRIFDFDVKKDGSNYWTSIAFVKNDVAPRKLYQAVYNNITASFYEWLLADNNIDYVSTSIMNSTNIAHSAGSETTAINKVYKRDATEIPNITNSKSKQFKNGYYYGNYLIYSYINPVDNKLYIYENNNGTNNIYYSYSNNPDLGASGLYDISVYFSTYLIMVYYNGGSLKYDKYDSGWVYNQNIEPVITQPVTSVSCKLANMDILSAYTTDFGTKVFLGGTNIGHITSGKDNFVNVKQYTNGSNKYVFVAIKRGRNVTDNNGTVSVMVKKY